MTSTAKARQFYSSHRTPGRPAALPATACKHL